MKQALSKKFLLAVEFTAVTHRGQYRKVPKNVPYVSHPYIVAHILADCGFSEDVVIAGLFHDLVEDTPTTLLDIESKFGKRIANLVSGVTEKNKTDNWEKRKQDYRDHLKKQSREVLAISAADLLANRLTLLISLETKGISTWAPFKANPQQYLDADSKRISIIKSKLKGRLVAQLDEIELKLAQLIHDQG